MKRGFTVVELLVVIAIIGVLIAILIPAIAKARTQSQRTACRAQLRDVGAAFVMYFNDAKGKLPAVNPMPSVKPPLLDAPSLVELLRPYVHTARGVFRCPSDRITKEVTSAPRGFETYFDREGSSYQYNPLLSLLGNPGPQDPFPGRLKHPERVAIIDEYESFHGRNGTPGAMNHLFLDMHVGALVE